MAPKKVKLLTLSASLGFLFALSQVYTNCSRAAVNMDEATSMTLPPEHPGAQSIQPAQYTTPLGHKKYIASIMQENFVNESSTSTWKAVAQSYLLTWADSEGAQLGYACNPYESYTGYDCSGSISNSNLPMASPSTTIREALRLHLCEEFMGYTEAVTAALQNAGVSAATPDADSIKKLAGLFYRADLPSEEFFATLNEMDEHLSEENLGATDRFRMILVELCESTEWQRL